MNHYSNSFILDLLLYSACVSCISLGALGLGPATTPAIMRTRAISEVHPRDAEACSVIAESWIPSGT